MIAAHLRRFGTVAIWLMLPILVALRVRAEIAAPTERGDAASLILPLLLGWTTLGALASALATRLRAGPARAAGRLLVVITIALSAMTLVDPYDPEAPTAAWISLLAWLGAGVFPPWSSTVLLRAHGAGLVRAFVIGALMPLPALLGAFVVVRFFGIADDGSAGIIATAGLLLSVAHVLAATDPVAAAPRRVSVAASAVALALSGAVAYRLSQPSISLADVKGIAVVERPGGRLVLRLTLPNLDDRLVEIGPPGYRLLPRHSSFLAYAGGTRFRGAPTARAVLTRRRTPLRVCGASDGAESCGPVLSFGERPQMLVHPREPLAALHGGGTLVALSATGAILAEAEHAPRRILWPCFEDGAAILYRVEAAEPPYDVFALDLGTGRTSRLPPDHPHRCGTDSPVPPIGEFVRGDTRVGRRSHLTGPGLPPEGVELPDPISTLVWSWDGRVAALVGAGDADRLAWYDEAGGVSAFEVVPGMNAVLISPDGSHLAYRQARSVVARRRSDPRWTLRVRSERGYAFLLDGRLAIVQDGDLVAIDLRTGTSESMFPPR